MQIRLTVAVAPRGARGTGDSGGAGGARPSPSQPSGSANVLVTAPTGTVLAAVTSALATSAAAALSAGTGTGAGAGPGPAAPAGLRGASGSGAGRSTGAGPEGASAAQGGEDKQQEPVVVYAGTRRLDPHRQIIGEPPLLDGAMISLHAPVAPAALSAHGAAVTAYGSAKARLHVVAGPDAGGIHLLQGGRVQLGRSADADVPLDDPDVSRLHCAVTVTDGGAVTVTDAGSTNGTSIDGAPVGARPVLFRPGSTLRIGETAIRLEAAGTPGHETAGAASAPPPLALPTAPDSEGRLRVVRESGEGATGRDGDGSPRMPAAGTNSGAEAAGPGGPGGHAYAPGGPFPGAEGTTHGAGFASPLPSGGRRDGHPAGGHGAEGDRRRARGLGAWARRFTGGRGEPSGPDAGSGPGSGTEGPGAGRGQGTAPDRKGHPYDPTGPGAAYGQADQSGPASPYGAAGPYGTSDPYDRAMPYESDRLDSPHSSAAPQGAPGSRYLPDAPVPRHPAHTRGDGGAAHPAQDGPEAWAGAGNGARLAPHEWDARWPDPAAVLLSALGPGPRLWERTAAHPDALTVRLGVAHRSGGHGEPVTVDLRQAGSLGLAGPRARLAGLTRAVLAQLTALHGPSALEVVVLSADRARDTATRTGEWAWLGWLPHLRPAHGQDCALLTAYDREQAAARTAELTRRLEAHAAAPGGGPPSSAVVVVVDGDPGSAALRASVTRLAREGAGAGIHLLCLAETPAASPASPVTATVEAANAACPAFSDCGTLALLSGDVATAVRVLHRAPRPSGESGRAPGHGSTGRSGHGSGRGPTSGIPRQEAGAGPAGPAGSQGSYGAQGPVGAHGVHEAYGPGSADGAYGVYGADRAFGTHDAPGVADTPGVRTPRRAGSGEGAGAADAAEITAAADVPESDAWAALAGPVATVDAVSGAWAERFARALAPLREPEGAGAPPGTARPAVTLPSSCRLLDELGLARATPAALLARWSEPAPGGGTSGRASLVFGAGPHGPLEADLADLSPQAASALPAPASGTGRRPGGAPLPGHALISGEPGAGKTELLRSLSASLAAGERPDRLALVLVDGAGAEAGQGLRACAELPHVTGHLAAGDPVRMREFAQALSAELKRRAELIGDQRGYEEYVRLAARPGGGRVVAQRQSAERAPAHARAAGGTAGPGPYEADTSATGAELPQERADLTGHQAVPQGGVRTEERAVGAGRDTNSGTGAGTDSGAGPGTGSGALDMLPPQTTAARAAESRPPQPRPADPRTPESGPAPAAGARGGAGSGSASGGHSTHGAGGAGGAGSAGRGVRAEPGAGLEPEPDVTRRTLRLRTREGERAAGGAGRAAELPAAFAVRGGGVVTEGAEGVLPRLAVLVDDFDTLVDPALGNPGRPAAGSVVRALESVARLGARLGVHLIVATGRPDRTASTAVARGAALQAELTGAEGGADGGPRGRGVLTFAQRRASVPAQPHSPAPGHGGSSANPAHPGSGGSPVGTGSAGDSARTVNGPSVPGDSASGAAPSGAAASGTAAEGPGIAAPPIAFQAGRVTGRIPRTATLRPTVVPLDWARTGDPPARRPVRELGNGPTDLALLASAMERAAQQASQSS